MPSPDSARHELVHLNARERVSLCETLDRVLNKGAVVAGEVTISVADVELLYLGLQLVLTSVETARESLAGATGLALEIGKESGHGAGRYRAGRE